MHTSFITRLLDLISPRLCTVCGQRLSPTEEAICSRCNLHLPRTGFHLDAYKNSMATMFWGRMKTERVAALMYYESHAETASIIHELKYGDRPDIGVTMGRMTAREVMGSGFFEGVDTLVPVPLARKRLRQRGYNQSLMIARGVSEVTGLPVLERLVKRTTFEGSQTALGRWERNENVEHVFELTGNGPDISGKKHLLIIDDVVTTGATITACAKALAQAGDVRFSVLSLALAKS